MARSFIDPSLVALATEPAAPPWNWNPGATFVQAFNDAQANQRAQEKMAMERELMGILLPQKRAEAEFNLKKLAYDTELLTDRYKLMTEEVDARRRFIKSGALSGGSGGSGSSSGSGGGTSGATTQPSKGFQSQFGFGSRFSNPPQAAATSKPTWRVVTPAQPQPGP